MRSAELLLRCFVPAVRVPALLWLSARPSADVPLPEGTQPPSDDQDDKDEAEPKKELERWADLGLQTVH